MGSSKQKDYRSRDVVFLEDQTLEDAKQEKPKSKVMRNSNPD